MCQQNKEIFLWSSTNLSTLNYKNLTDEDIKKIAKFIDTDGCTGVSDMYWSACVTHDFWYTHKVDFDGSPIEQKEADKRFRKLIQKKSPFGFFSPMSWWRWAGVSLFGKKFWDN